ncbi:MAG: YegS/Rv2252/BmrU family lipid kinase [Specibacter sp.]
MTSSPFADDGTAPAEAPVPRLNAAVPVAPKALRIAVAINPRAAFGGRGPNTPGHIGEMVVERLRAAGHQVAVLRRGNYDELAQAVRAEVATGAQALVVVGGDGMVHLGVNALAHTSIPLGIVPAGTGNDAARGLGLDPKNPAAAVDHFLLACQRMPRTIDLGRIERAGSAPVWFMCALSAGFDALVNERANGWQWPHGPMRYNLAILRELLTLKPVQYSLVVDGERREQRAVLISVANGPSIGGGMKITPDASYDDGLLDLFVVSPVSRLTFLRIYPLVFSGRHTGHRAVSIERVTEVSLTSTNLVAYADGERIGALPATTRVDPGALRVWA